MVERAEAVGSDLSALLVGLGSGSTNMLDEGKGIHGQHNSMRWVSTMHNEAAVCTNARTPGGKTIGDGPRDKLTVNPS